MHTYARRKSPLIPVLAGMTATVIALAGCSSSSKSTSSPTSGSAGGSSTGTSSGSPTATGADAEVAAAQKELNAYLAPVTSVSIPGSPLQNTASLKGKTVFFIPITSKVPFFQILSSNLHRALAKLGIHVTDCDGGLTPSGVSACMNQAVATGAAAILTGAVPYQMAPTSFDAVAAKGIPVYMGLAIAPPGTVNKNLVFGSLSATETLVAQLEADAVIVDSKAQAHVLFIRVIDSQELSNQGDATVDALKSRCAKCTVVVKSLNVANTAQLPAQVSGALVSNPDINYIVGETDTQVQPAITGAQSSGYLSKVKIYGTTGDLGGLQRVQAGSQVADIGYSAAFVGWSEADAIVRLMLGQSVPTTYPPMVRVFDKSNIGSLTLTLAEQSTNNWYGSSSYEADYAKLWGLN